MVNEQQSQWMHLPFKNIALALIFAVVLGPVGLLYASFWGGVVLIPLGIVMVCCRFMFLAMLVWIVSCIWAVRAVELYNKNIIIHQK